MSVMVAAGPVTMGTRRTLGVFVAGCQWIKTILQRSHYNTFGDVDDRLLADIGLLRCAAFE